MNKEQLVDFIARITMQPSMQKVSLNLRELERILREQGHTSLLPIVRSAISSLPELHDIAKEQRVTEQAIAIAAQRAAARHRREAEMARRGRC